MLANTRLSPYTTFRLGGSCALFRDCATSEELVEAVCDARAVGRDFVLLGGGSNVLISDFGYSGQVIRFSQDDLLPEFGGDQVEVSAAASLDVMVAWLAKEGFEGLNFCSGIPGTVGGAIVGNAGAWGKQIGDSLHRVEVLGADGRVVVLDRDALAFSYRSSRLKVTGDIVLRAWFNVRRVRTEALFVERHSILACRAEKHPDLSTHPCIGSIFKNVEPSSAADRRQAAGFFLEEAGVKDLRVGGAYVFPKHANIITVDSRGTAEDVFQLHLLMRDAVRAVCGLDLEREVRFLGCFDGAESSVGYF